MTQTLTTETDEIHTRIVTAVAALEGGDPLELPPLFDAVDPDALEALFAPTVSDTARVGTVEFPYAGHTITVEFDDRAVVTVR